MPTQSARRPSFDRLEGRLAMSTLGVPNPAPYVPPVDRKPLFGVLAGGQPATVSDLQAFTAAYLSVRGQPRYNAALDVNNNGRIGLVDGRLLEQHSPPETTRIRLSLDVIIAPADQVQGPRPKNSGGVTRKSEVTILGHTTPGALIFADSGMGNYSFTGPAFVADRRGRFSFRQPTPVGLITDTFLIFDQFGKQTIRAFPIISLASPLNPEPAPRPL